MGLGEDYLKHIVDTALTEDLGLSGDITSQAIFTEDKPGKAVIVAKQRGVIAGLFVAEAVFYAVDSTVRFEARIADGDLVEPEDVVIQLAGNLLAILSAERIALNFLGHMSGIATLTREYVEQAAPYGVAVKDTRKTLPGLRALEKYAVLVGGGRNHRFGLYDAVLIKDNHIQAAGGITEAVARVRNNLKEKMPVEIEVRTAAEVTEALAAGADIIMLDNMDAVGIAAAVAIIGDKAEVEVSGGVTLENIAQIAAAGPDFLSVGALTQSAPAFDFSLRVT
ncbi:MAG: carboxylating nicotinate-nucleotide diphosphorylase [Actinomycetota bacterium]